VTRQLEMFFRHADADELAVAIWGGRQFKDIIQSSIFRSHL
jgi:hypothetical protein